MATILERFLSHIVILPNGCWEWTAYILPGGYGMFGVSAEDVRLAHRASYEFHIGPIPDGLDLDHKCHDPKICAGGKTCPHRRCVNPDHLKPEPRKVNCSPERSSSNQIAARAAILAKTHCPSGHPYDSSNTRIYRGKRYCRVCLKAVDDLRAEAFSSGLCAVCMKADHLPNKKKCAICTARRAIIAKRYNDKQKIISY